MTATATHTATTPTAAPMLTGRARLAASRLNSAINSGDQADGDEDAERHDDEIVEIAENRNEIRDEVDGRQGIGATAAATALATHGVRRSRAASHSAITSTLMAPAQDLRRCTRAGTATLTPPPPAPAGRPR